MLRAASWKLASTAGPAMTRAFFTPRLWKRPRRAAVLGPSSVASSSTIRVPALALDDRAWRRARARTFLGRSKAWLRTTGPWALAPPTNWAARREPWRAPPVPFWRYIFLPVRETSLRTWILWVPARRLASCQVTQRCRMSARMSSIPKIASESSIEPPFPPSSLMTSSFIRLLPQLPALQRQALQFRWLQRPSPRPAGPRRPQAPQQSQLLRRLRRPAPHPQPPEP